MMGDIDDLHACHLEALLRLDAVCRELDIPYFIIGGTLLGAVRHGGFIPWDDDVDVAMLRDDYERFQQLAPAVLGDKYFLQSFASEPAYALCYAKLRVNGTWFSENSSDETDIHHGVFLDIFPLDNAPDSAALKTVHMVAARVLIMAVHGRSGYDSELTGAQAVAFQAIGLASKPWKRTTLINALGRVMRWFDSKPGRDVVNIGGAYGYKRESNRRDAMVPPIRIEFEGHLVAAPHDPKNYLEHLYGDFMTPPPPAQQVPRHANAWKLNDTGAASA